MSRRIRLDVACQPAAVLIEGAILRGADLEDLMLELNVDRDALCRGEGWLDWESYSRLFDNALRSVGEEGVVDIGRHSFESPIWPYIITTASLFWSPTEFWTFGVKGPLAKLYPCLSFAVDSDDLESMNLAIVVANGHRSSWPLALAFKGQALAVAESFGHTDVSAEIAEITNGHRITVRWGSRPRLRTKLSRLFQIRRVMRFAAKDVLATRSELLQRMKELESEIREREAVEKALRREIAERLALAEQVKRTQRLRSVGLLAAGVAHDFNNLLTAIIGHAELALLGGGLPDNARKNLDGIIAASENATRLTQRLLAFGRPQAARPEHFDVNAALADIDGLLQKLIPSGVTLETRPGEGPFLVCADRGQLEQVVLNLCVNAGDASSSGDLIVVSTECVDVESRMRLHPNCPAGTYIVLDVTDTGAGMSGETRDQIFEPFFTTKGDGEGNGLGLSMVIEIVEAHRGFIDVASQLGEGTRVRIFLPQASAQS